MLNIRYNTKFIFPQIDHYSSAKDVKYISLGKVLFDIKNVFNSMVYDTEFNETVVIFFYNFNGFLKIIDNCNTILNNITKVTKKIDKVLILTVIEGDKINQNEPVLINNINFLNNKYNLTICPVSLYTYDIIKEWQCINNLKIKMCTIPHAIDTRLFCISNIKNNDITKLKGYKFLYIGTNNYRKNLKLLVDSFIEEFGDNEEVLLIIKTNENKDLGFNKNIFFIPEIDEEILPDIYRSVDCMVLPTKCEGFGLPVLESLLCGTPVITPYHTGIKTFVEKDDVIPIECKSVEILEKHRAEITMGSGNWYYIDKDDLKYKMRTVFNNRNTYKKDNNINLARRLANEYDIFKKYTKFIDHNGFTKEYIDKYATNDNYGLEKTDGYIINTRELSLIKLFRFFDNNNIKPKILTNSKNNWIINLFTNFINFKDGIIHSNITSFNTYLNSSSMNYNIIFIDYEKLVLKNTIEIALLCLKNLISIYKNVKEDTFILIDHNTISNNKIVGHGMLIYDYFNEINIKPFSLDYLLIYKLNK